VPPIHLDESVSASPEYSPGVVLDSELLLREMIDPHHVKDGKVLKSAISLGELRSEGFSLHRKEYVSLDFVQECIERRLSKAKPGYPRKDAGVAKILTRDVRKIRENGERLFVVIDTAKPDNHGHASIYAANPKLSEADAREVRSHLSPLLNNRESLEQVFRSR